MANSYTRLYNHVVFAVRNRQYVISAIWEQELFMYLSGLLSNKGQKAMIINGMPDHIHLLIGMKPDCTLSDLVRDLKSNSSRWINEKKFVNGKFEWQQGYGAFSVSYSHVSMVANYIENQKKHHEVKKFREEYISLLVNNGIEFDPQYLFEEI